MQNNHGDHLTPERYAPHLSEFYSIVNNKSSPNDRGRHTLQPPFMDDVQSTSTMSRQNVDRGNNYSRRASSVRSGMSTISDLATLITKRDMKSTTDAMTDVLKSSEDYASSLRNVAHSASSMGHSLETLARLKGCNDEAADKLLNASGLFYLIANHEQIMSQTINTILGSSLQDDIDKFNMNSKTLENKFKSQCKEQSMKLKLQEKHNVDLSKRKVRNLLLYRESLSNLQSQVDELETLRHDFYQDSYMLVESTCEKLVEDIASVSRAQVEISENVARKGWSGGGLDDLLLNADDPFNKDIGTEEEEEEEEEGNADLGDGVNGTSQCQKNIIINNDEHQYRSNHNSRENSVGNSTVKETNIGLITESTDAKEIVHSLDSDGLSNNIEQHDDTDGDESDSNFNNSFSLPISKLTKPADTDEDKEISKDTEEVIADDGENDTSVVLENKDDMLTYELSKLQVDNTQETNANERI